MEEIWKEVPQYEGYYEVSSQGRVRSLDRVTCDGRSIKGRVLKTGLSKGYKMVVLNKNSKRKTFNIHKLVAIAFLNHKPDGTMNIVVDHINSIKTDNRLENLQLISNRENCSKDRKNKTSKYTGVNWNKQQNKWQSMIQVNSKNKYLGLFDSEEKASQYYQDALISIEKGTEIKTNINKKSSKYKGVHWHKQRNKWASQIIINKKRKYLGLFNCETAAFLAYQAELSKISVEN